MPFVATHVRLTNSGKIPDLFLTARVQQASDLTEAKLGKLSFVLQIDAPWNHVSSIGSSLMNTISREYFRQEGSVPLESFEKAIAKGNQLVQQLSHEGEFDLAKSMHALVALTVNDELHLAYTGEAEAYFLHERKLSLITEPGSQKGDRQHVFTNLITGEISSHDVVVLGSPGLYGAITPDELEQILQEPFSLAALALARRLKSAKMRKANAVLLTFQSQHDVENTVLTAKQETIYLDQQIDSIWSIARYYGQKLTTPLITSLVWAGAKISKISATAARKSSSTWQKMILPKSQAIFKAVSQKAGTIKPKAIPIPKLPALSAFSIPKLASLGQSVEAGVPVNHYDSQKRHQQLFAFASKFSFPVRVLREVGRQFRLAVRRSPRTWYAIIALLILASIGASIQTRKKTIEDRPIITAATLEEVRTLVTDAKKAKVTGNGQQARALYLEAVNKAELAKENSKLADEAQALLAAAQKELYNLSGASGLTAINPLLKIGETPRHIAIYEGTLYYFNKENTLKKLALTGGDAIKLAQIPLKDSVSQMHLDRPGKQIFAQGETGQFYRYSLETQKLTPLQSQSAEKPASSAGLATFGEIIYSIDPASRQVLRYTIKNEEISEMTNYIRQGTADFTLAQDLAIDGSVFILKKDGGVSKYRLGRITDFKLGTIPAPFDRIENPVNFFAVEEADRYYLTDLGGQTSGPRIIETDKNGKFNHQYFLPKDWSGKITQIQANPKSHKAWVVVNNELYEFTLIQ